MLALLDGKADLAPLKDQLADFQTDRREYVVIAEATVGRLNGRALQGQLAL